MRRLWALLLAGIGVASAQTSPILDVLNAELRRNWEVLRKEPSPPYYMSYAVTETEEFTAGARFGAVYSRRQGKVRQLDVTVRVGSRTLDNYRAVDGQPPRFTLGVRLPLEDRKEAIDPILWRETDRVYRGAVQRLESLKTRKEQKVAETDLAPDFSEERPNAAVQEVPNPKVDAALWEQRIRKVSAIFNAYPDLLTASVSVSFTRQVKNLVDSDSARLRHGRTFARVVIAAGGKAADGMNLGANRSFEAETLDGLPGEKELLEAARQVAEQTRKLAQAPVVTPFVGPAILSGSASGVFFHEIFGHRIEGHRQKDVTDTNTFAKSVGKPVLPDFLSVVSDPTRERLGGVSLYGRYSFDDEGVAARKVTLVEKGVLKEFLMSRSPLSGSGQSNGHGRRQPGLEVVSRQSNLIVESGKRVSEAKLRELLLDEVKRQGKPFGLFFQQVTGGFTQTQRAGLGAFKVLPIVVYRVYADGRPDELVRGVDIVGTPLASFSKIVATSDKDEVFNGYCGAESGSVPVSAAAPSILVSELEVQAQESSQDRPPILPNPLAGGGQ